jgi:hypothetical protein
LLLLVLVAFAEVLGVGAAHLPADVVAEVRETDRGVQQSGELVGDAGKPVAGVFQLSEESCLEAAVLGVGDGREEVVAGAQAELQAVQDMLGRLVIERSEVVPELVCQPLPASRFSLISCLLIAGVLSALGAVEEAGQELLGPRIVADLLPRGLLGVKVSGARCSPCG